MKRIFQYCFQTDEPCKKTDASTQTPNRTAWNEMFAVSPMRKSFSDNALCKLRERVQKHEVSSIILAEKAWLSKVSIDMDISVQKYSRIDTPT